MHNLKTNFDKIMVIVKQSLNTIIDESGNLHKKGKKAHFSDLEVISLAITSEALSITSENLLFKKIKSDYHEQFPNIIDRSQFNRRRRHLKPLIQKVQTSIASQLTFGEDTFIIDSMPVPICKIARAKGLKICKETVETSPEFGYCAAQKTYYYGFKFHGVCSLNGIFTDFDLSKANIHDIHYLKDVKGNYPNCLMLGDKGYLNSPYQLELFRDYRLTVKTPMRENQIDYRPQPKVFRKARKRIETLYSQLHDQFQIGANYAKSFQGIAVRILTKITAITVLQLVNKLNNRPLNHIKHALA